MASAALAQTNTPIKMERDPNQSVYKECTKKIRKYATEPFLNSPLTDKWQIIGWNNV